MTLVRPDWTEALRLQQPARPSFSRGFEVRFELPDLSEIRNVPGEWSAEFFVRISGHRLGGMVLHVVDTQAMIDDLELADFHLTSGDGEELPINCTILNTINSIVPLATLRLRSLNPNRLGELRVQLVLCRAGESAAQERIERALEFVNGICLISEIVFDTGHLRTGPYEVRVYSGPRLLEKLAFTLVSSEEVLANIRVESFELIGIETGGRQLVLGHSAVASQLVSVVPVIRLRNPFPLPSQNYQLTVGVSSGENILGYIDHHATLESLVNEVLPGELSMDHLQPGMECSFFIMLENRCLCFRQLKLIGETPRVADIQGRLRFAEAADLSEADSEAARLIREIHVVS